MITGDVLRLGAFAALLFALSANAANRCTSADGKVTYQDAQCPNSAKSSQRLQLQDNTVEAAVPRVRSGVGGVSNVGGEAPGDTIALKCARDWPNDFRMRAYCERKQAEGFRSLDRALDASTTDAAVIRIKCSKDWPDDYRMRAYCERKQVEALRELGR